MVTAAYTPDEKSITKDVIAKYKNRGVFIINPDDPLLIRFYGIQKKLAGITAGNYPQFSQYWQDVKQFNLNVGQPGHAINDNVLPVYSIVRVDSVDGKNYQADAIGSLPVSATNVTQTLGLFDASAANAGTVNYTKNYINTADCAISAEGLYPDSETTSEFPVTVIYTFAQIINNGVVYGAEIITTQSYPKEIYNESPKTINNPNEIKICLTRYEPDCDYTQTYAGDGTVSVPIKGYITYGGDIDVIGGRPVNGMSRIYLIRSRAGGNAITPYEGFDFFDPKNS